MLCLFCLQWWLLCFLPLLISTFQLFYIIFSPPLPLRKVSERAVWWNLVAHSCKTTTVQPKVMRMMNRIKHLSNEKKLRELVLFTLEKRILKVFLLMKIDICWREKLGGKGRDRLLPVLPSDKAKTTWTNFEIQEIQLEHKKKNKIIIIIIICACVCVCVSLLKSDWTMEQIA